MQTRDLVLEPVDASGRLFRVSRDMVDNLLRDQLVTRLRDPKKHLGEDLKMRRLGVLDSGSMRSGYELTRNPVEFVVTSLLKPGERVHPDLIVRDPKFFTEPVQIGKNVWVDKAFDMRERKLTAIRRQHNQRTTLGRDQWQRLAMFGDVSATAYTTQFQGVAATSTSATSVTNTGANFPTQVTDAVTASNTTVTSATAAFTNMDVGRPVSGTNIPANTFITAVASATSCTISNAATGSGSGGTLTISRLQGKIVNIGSGNGKNGVVLSNTPTVITVDQWRDPTSTTGAAASSPGATAVYEILNGALPALWLGLCATGGSGNPPSGGHSPVAGDVLRGADGLFGDGTFTAAATEQTGSGLGRAFVVPTFPAAGQTQLSNLFTYTGSSVVTLDVAILCNSKAFSGSILFLVTQLNASAAVSANGDTVTPTWTITL